MTKIKPIPHQAKGCFFNDLIYREKNMTQQAQGFGAKTKLFTVLAVLTLAVTLSVTAFAATILPTGFNVAAGNGDVSTPTIEGSAMTVRQNSERAIIDWKTFNIGSNASVTFNQPDAAARWPSTALPAAPILREFTAP